MEKLTIDKLKRMAPDTIFASGTTQIRHPWFSTFDSARKRGAWRTVDRDGMVVVRWVALRGTIHDWAIYHSLDANLERSEYMDGVAHLLATDWQIARAGAKLHDIEKVADLVPCTDEALRMYRH